MTPLMNRFLPLLAITLLALVLPACTTNLQQKESFLREAGFRAVKPSTPAQVSRVQTLPQGHITQVTRKGKTLFVLADAKQNLLFIGGNPQFERYQQILYTKKVDSAIANEKADKMLENDWGGWGGMMDPFFGGPMMMY
jgi:hypothetical protein